MRELLQKLGWGLLPGICLLCELPSHRPRDICCYCEASLPWNDSACRRCALPLNAESAASSHPFCLKCRVADQTSGSLLQCRTIAAFHYRNPVDVLLHKLKFRDGFLENRVLGALLADCIQRNYRNNRNCRDNRDCTNAQADLLPELILPVPLAWPRLVRRGYNQAGILASRLSQELKIPVNHHALVRTRHTQAQSSLNRSQRRRNLQRAFRLRKPLKQCRIALVDDVMTTGATLDSVAHCLRETGLVELHYWVLARTDLSSHANPSS